IQRGKAWQARGARQTEAGLFIASLYFFQQLLILWKCADFIEKELHRIWKSVMSTYNESQFPIHDSRISPLYLFIALSKPSVTKVNTASAARSRMEDNSFISSLEKF